jgi:predicted kinase
MEAVIFCGIQAAGKTTFYVQRFLRTHLRISMDLLHTRNKERQLLELCYGLRQRFVVDNTNPTRKDRAPYIEGARLHKFRVIGYYFDTDIAAAVGRNAERTGKEKIPVPGLRGTYKKLEPPQYSEGFDDLYRVEIVDHAFVVTLIAKEEG